MKYPHDITGLKFGKLTVQSYSYKDTNNKTYWSCLCDCGNTKIIRRNCLVSNTTLSCGCLKQEASNKRHNSLIGQVFDRLTVIELSEQKNNKRSGKWLCKCTCGNNTIVGTTELNNKKVRSCCCLRSELHKELAIKNGAKAYYRVKTVSEDDKFIEGLKNIVMDKVYKIAPCPKKFCKCFQKNN